MDTFRDATRHTEGSLCEGGNACNPFQYVVTDIIAFKILAGPHLISLDQIQTWLVRFLSVIRDLVFDFTIFICEKIAQTYVDPNMEKNPGSEQLKTRKF